MNLQLGKFNFSYQKEEPPVQINELLGAETLADSALYTHYNMPYYNPNKLYEKTGGYDLFDDMRQDDQISAVLNLMKYIILGAEWDIDTDDDKVKEFITNNFNSLDEIFAKKLYNILSGMDYGFSLTEKIFKEDGGKIVIDKLKTRMPHNFEFILDDYGNVKRIDQNVKGPSIELKPEKFIHFVYQAEFDNPYGTSAMNQGVYRAYWSKNAIIKFWNIYLERHGMPFGVGTYPKTAGQGAINDLKKIGKNIQAKTFATFPDGFAIDFKEAAKGTDNYERAIDKYNMMIARAMLVPDLLGLSGGGTEGGSYALGEKQFEMFYSIVDFIRQQLQKTVTENLVKPLVFYNFGSDIEAEFKFNVVDSAKKAEMLNLWITAVNGGKIPITDTHINWFLQNIEAPEIDQKELDEINAKKEEIANAIQGNKDPDTEGKPGEDKNPEDEEKKEDEKKLILYTKKVDYAKIEKDMDDIEAKYKEELAGLYKLAVNALTDEIKRKQIIEKKKFDQINGLDLKHQAKIQKTLKKMLSDSLQAGSGTVQKNYLVEDTLVLDDEDIARWIDSYAFYVSDMEAGFILGKVKPALIEGIREGSGVKEIMTMIDNALKGYDITLDMHRIETMVRTVVSSGYNEGRLQQFGKIQDQIQGYQYDAVLDRRTSELCERLHGRVLKPNEVNTYNPPNHFNALVEGSMILTDKGYKNIEIIEVGEYVLTHKNRFKKVTEFMSKFEDKEYYEIQLDDGKKIEVTGEHPLLTDRGWIEVENLKLSDNIICFEDIGNV